MSLFQRRGGAFRRIGGNHDVDALVFLFVCGGNAVQKSRPRTLSALEGIDIPQPYDSRSRRGIRRFRRQGGNGENQRKYTENPRENETYRRLKYLSLFHALLYAAYLFPITRFSYAKKESTENRFPKLPLYIKAENTRAYSRRQIQYSPKQSGICRRNGTFFIFLSCRFYPAFRRDRKSVV